MSLLSKMHEMYAHDDVSIYICGLLEKYLEDVKGYLNEVECNRFLEFATFYLVQKEKELGLLGGNLSLEERWNNVRAKLLGRGHLSLEGALAIVKSYSPNGCEAEYRAQDSVLFVTVENTVSEGELEALREALQEYLPAHILIWDFDVHINTYGEISSAKRTQGELGAYTQEDMRYKYEVIAYEKV